MRKSDKIKNIIKANLLTEQRFVETNSLTRISEETRVHTGELDLANGQYFQVNPNNTEIEGHHLAGRKAGETFRAKLRHNGDLDVRFQTEPYQESWGENVLQDLIRHKQIMAIDVKPQGNQPMAEISQGLAARATQSFNDKGLGGDEHQGANDQQGQTLSGYINPALASEIKKLGFDIKSSGNGIQFMAAVSPGFGGGKAMVTVTKNGVEVVQGGGKILNVRYLENAKNANIAVEKIQQDF